MAQRINEFRGKYSFLSNFYRFTDGPTVEHLYQAEKTLDPALRARILLAGTPAKAKSMGKNVPLRKNWDKKKLKIMESLVTVKFTRFSKMEELLIKTGDAELIEGNWWGDTFWGVYDGIGENHLGKIIMKIREKL